MKNSKIQNKNLFGFTLASDATEDYLAARILFEKEHILPAIQLATTAIEKLFKSFINIAYDEMFDKRVHEPYQLYLCAEEGFKHHGLKFSTDFLFWLDQVYHSRYSSNLYPAKEITFGEKHFLMNLDEIFYKTFEFYKKCNDELASLYFCKTFLSQITTNNHIHQGLKKEDESKKAQKIFSFFFIDGRRTDVKTHIRAFNPSNPFVFKDVQIQGESVVFNLDVGTLSPMDLPPDYWTQFSR